MANPAKTFVEKIYRNSKFARSISPELFPTSISRGQGQFLVDFLELHQPQTIIECGFGFGVSSLWLQASSHQPKKHFIIDPYLETKHTQIYKFLKQRPTVIFEERKTSQQFLANFESKRQHADLIFMDGDEHFDGFITDLYFSLRVLSPTGYIITRNIWSPSIRKALLFLIKNVPLELPQFSYWEQQLMRRLPSYGDDHLKSKLNALDFCVLRLNGADPRPWNHFVNF